MKWKMTLHIFGWHLVALKIDRTLELFLRITYRHRYAQMLGNMFIITLFSVAYSRTSSMCASAHLSKRKVIFYGLSFLDWIKSDAFWIESLTAFAASTLIFDKCIFRCINLPFKRLLDLHMALKRRDYSEDFRNLVVERRMNGDSLDQIAKYMSMPWTTIQSIIKKFKMYKTVKYFPDWGRISWLQKCLQQRYDVEWLRSDTRSG